MEALPADLEEAIEVLKTFYSKDLATIKGMTESQFLGSSHFGAGMFIRNNWCLWWRPGYDYDSWPKEQPKLNAWFENIGIVHADDMSGIILTSLYRHMHGLDLDIEGQVEYYKKHWKAQGYEDGIPKD